MAQNKNCNCVRVFVYSFGFVCIYICVFTCTLEQRRLLQLFVHRYKLEIK